MSSYVDTIENDVRNVENELQQSCPVGKRGLSDRNHS